MLKADFAPAIMSFPDATTDVIWASAEAEGR